MTQQRRDSQKKETDWTRSVPELDSRLGFNDSDVDFVWHRYKGLPYHAMMLIEQKTYRKPMENNQRETLGFLGRMLHAYKTRRMLSMRNQSVEVRYFGYHLLEFERESPDDGRIWWNGQEITKQQLVQIMRFEIDPRSVGAKRQAG